MDPEEQTITLARETRSSIELKRNAKGEYAWDIKIYFEDGYQHAESD